MEEVFNHSKDALTVLGTGDERIPVVLAELVMLALWRSCPSLHETFLALGLARLTNIRTNLRHWRMW
jgi:hypothetical protein